MIVGTILLTKDYKYVTDDGKLPKRPRYDKELLAGIIAGGKVSDAGYNMLPLSLQKLVTVSTVPNTPITIQELAKSDLLIVSKSLDSFEGGKVFRLDNFKLLLKDRKVELWMRIH